VRPLRQMNGDAHFSEVFVSGARVPDDWRIGDVGAGWAVAMTVLTNERQSIGNADAAPPGLSPDAVPGWLRDLSDRGCLRDPVLRQRAVQAYILEQVNRMSRLRASAGAAAGRPPGPEGSGGKLRHVRAFKARAEVLKDAAGAYGLLAGPPGAD